MFQDLFDYLLDKHGNEFDFSGEEDREGNTVLHLAAAKAASAPKILEGKMDTFVGSCYSFKFRFFFSALVAKLRERYDSSGLKELVDKPNGEGATALMNVAACEGVDLLSYQLIVSMKPDVNSQVVVLFQCQNLPEKL